MKMSRAERFAEDGNACWFGITEGLAAGLAGGLGALGAGGGLIGTAAAPGLLSLGLAGAGLGAAGGAGLGAITGEGAGKGALFGGLTGGAVAGLGPALGSLGEAAGLPAGIADVAGPVVAGLGAGAAGSAITGQPLLAGTLEGGATGLVSGLGAAGTPATPAPGASAVPAGGAAGAGASPASPAFGGGGVAPSGDLTGPAGLPAGTPNVNFGLTDQSVGPGVIGGAGAIGTSLAAPTAGAATLPQDFSGGLDAASSGLPVGGTDTGGGGFLSKLTSNPAALIGAGGLGLAALRQNQPLPEQAQLNQIGAQEQATGNQLASYVNTGTLPPGAQESVNLATNAAKAQVRSTAAQLGLSGSTWEADRMGQIDQQAAAQSTQIATQLLQLGANYSQLSTGVFESLMKSTLAEDQQFQQALSSFASGLAGHKFVSDESGLLFGCRGRPVERKKRCLPRSTRLFQAIGSRTASSRVERVRVPSALAIMQPSGCPLRLRRGQRQFRVLDEVIRDLVG